MTCEDSTIVFTHGPFPWLLTWQRWLSLLIASPSCSLQLCSLPLVSHTLPHHSLPHQLFPLNSLHAPPYGLLVIASIASPPLSYGHAVLWPPCTCPVSPHTWHARLPPAVTLWLRPATHQGGRILPGKQGEGAYPRSPPGLLFARLSFLFSPSSLTASHVLSVNVPCFDFSVHSERQQTDFIFSGLFVTILENFSAFFSLCFSVHLAPASQSTIPYVFFPSSHILCLKTYSD